MTGEVDQEEGEGGEEGRPPDINGNRERAVVQGKAAGRKAMQTRAKRPGLSEAAGRRALSKQLCGSKEMISTKDLGKCYGSCSAVLRRYCDIYPSCDVLPHFDGVIRGVCC